MSMSYPEAGIFHSEARVLASSIVGIEYKISIWLPPSYVDSDKTYPVLYLLDGNTCFGLATDTVTALTFGQEVPELIVVGIGYVNRNQRGRDLLWAHDRFYAFLTEELIPFVDGEYRTDTRAPRTLVGHSDGGFFTLLALFQSGGHSNAPFVQFVAISGDLTKNEWLPFREYPNCR